ncbi:hypothetical protein CISG_04198 [Coccidioides immitis RMSCC 3703]|uniref:Uncharacterized protein n=1 Tax=Coccidioides immitis RMSCC 3703 TaxID=454286 RepID=A0A0J8QT79_COCIT|nr:hypothetical protein CISG_04198 [Coccidioides immitis RMSCC 3703]
MGSQPAKKHVESGSGVRAGELALNGRPSNASHLGPTGTLAQPPIFSEGPLSKRAAFREYPRRRCISRSLLGMKVEESLWALLLAPDEDKVGPARAEAFTV